LFGPIGLMSPTYWVGLMLDKVGAMLNTSPTPRPTKQVGDDDVIEAPLLFQDKHGVPPVLRAIPRGRSYGKPRELDVLEPA